MGKGNQPKHRQVARDLRRRNAVRQPYERLLIICEGEKTEPQYLREIQNHFRLATAHVQVLQGQLGTAPMQVLDYALSVFKNGSPSLGIHPKAFDRIVVVFDRDEHKSYHAALAKAAAHSGKLKNENGTAIPIDTAVSVPCFELWLLLHFEDVLAPLHRHEVVERLQNYLPGYEKGSGGHWAATHAKLADATRRAKHLFEITTVYDGTKPYTAMHELVSRLMHLKD